MSIGRRLIDLARAELNSLLERAGESDDDEEPGRRDRKASASGIGAMSDAELEAELERRQRAREAAAQRREASEEAERMRQATAEAERATRGGSSGTRRSGPRPSSRPSVPVDQVARAYAALEVPVGSDFETVRRAYRNLMRKYHPDHHTASPEKQKAANELAQKLTDAYRLLEKRLRK